MTITVKITDETLASEVANGGEPLRLLCRKEVEAFETYLRGLPDSMGYSEGLVDWEKAAIEGYLYQKIRGHLSDAKDGEIHPGDRRKNGTP